MDVEEDRLGRFNAVLENAFDIVDEQLGRLNDLAEKAVDIASILCVHTLQLFSYHLRTFAHGHLCGTRIIRTKFILANS